MIIQDINVNSIKPYKNNPRKNDQAVAAVAESIRQFGFKVPLVIDKNNEIVAGHTRLKAALQLGIQTVPCLIADDLTEEQIKAFRLADNKTAELADWDFSLLNLELEELSKLDLDFSLVDFGFDIGTAEEIKEDDFDAEKAIEEIETPITQKGDIWLLGKHRLLCGDATSSDDVTNLMNGQEADLVLTDPPYNVDYEGGTKDKLKIQNDKMQDNQFLHFLTDAFTRMYEHSKKGAAIYVFHADSEGYNFRSAFKQAGYSLRQCLVWAKNSLVLGRQDYQWQHEPILYGWKDGASHAWYGDRKQTTLIKFDKPQRSADHPTMKPIGLCGYLIGNSSKEGDIVLDSFGGSGSTLMACEQTGRICYTLELDPKYCDVTIRRWEEFTGKKAELLDG